MRPDHIRFLSERAKSHAGFYATNISDMVVAMATRNHRALEDARYRLGEVIRETMGVAEVLGARSVLGAAAPLFAQQFRGDPHQSLTRGTFQQALQSLIDRAPVALRDSAERTAQQISRLYATDNVIAFAKSAEESVTRKVQSMIAQFLKDGVPESQAGSSIAAEVAKLRELSDPWSESYAAMVFRTNVNTAITQGRFRQASDPSIRAILPAFRFVSMNDKKARHNHKAAHGVIMGVADDRWGFLAPPLGYNCRCGLRPVPITELRNKGLVNKDGSVRKARISSAAGPDEGFRAGPVEFLDFLVLD